MAGFVAEPEDLFGDVAGSDHVLAQHNTILGYLDVHLRGQQRHHYVVSHDYVAPVVGLRGIQPNGAAMRVAPVGLLFHHDLNAVWEQAAISARPTHRHQVGVEAAQVMALAVALAVGADSIDRKPFLRQLRERVTTEEIGWALDTAIGLRKGDQYSVLGSGLEAHRSVVTAIALFAAEGGDFDRAVGRCVALGDDTDTLAAMAGALCGALGGVAAIPERLWSKLEDGP